MPFADEKPTLESMQTHDEHFTTMWADTFSKWAELDSYYHRTNELWPRGKAQAERSSLHTSTATRIVDNAADTQMAFSPRVHRPPARENDTNSQQLADRIEPWLEAVLKDAALKETTLPFKQMGRHLIMYGRAVADGMRIDPEFYKGRPRKKKGENADAFEERVSIWEDRRRNLNPYIYRAPHPARVLMDPAKKQPDIAIHHFSMFAFDLEDLTRRREAEGKNVVTPYSMGDTDAYEELELTELWTPSWHSLMTQTAGELVFVEKNGAGFQPFTHAFTGWGMEPTDLTEINPKFLAKGILEPVLETIKVQQQRMSAQHEMIIDAAYAMKGTTGDPGEYRDQREGGDILTGRPSDYWREDLPNLPQWMFQMGDELGQDIREGTLAMDLAGFRQEGVTTVGQQAILTTAAKGKFAVASAQLDDMGTILGRRCLQLLHRQGEKVTVRGLSLKPEDLQGNFAVDVSFELIDPVLQQQERELLMTEYQQRLISKEDYWSGAKKEDATGIRRRLAKDRVYEREDVMAAEEQVAMQELGLANLEANQREAAASPGGGGLELPSEQAPNPADPRNPSNGVRELRQPLTGDVRNPARIQGATP